MTYFWNSFIYEVWRWKTALRWFNPAAPTSIRTTLRLMHYLRLLREGPCAVNYGKHTPPQKGRGHLCLFIGSQFFAPASWPALMLFLWFPKLLLDTVKFGTGHRSGSASRLLFVGFPCPSNGFWQPATPTVLWHPRWLATVTVSDLWLVSLSSC